MTSSHDELLEELRGPVFGIANERRDELARRFFAAVEDGDVGALEALLAHDVVLSGDGGGKAPALARALHGRSRVARTLLAWARAGTRIEGLQTQLVGVNGQPGAMTLNAAGELINVMALDVADGRIQAVSSIVNPDKLRHLGAVADLSELLKPA